MDDAPLMLSVSGLRGLVGRSLTPPVAARYGAAFGHWLGEQAHSGIAPHVVVGRDSRPTGQMVEMAVVAGLVATGCRVTRLGIATTPATAVMIEHLGAQGGMVITASHNPAPWNGIKALRHDGLAPPPEQAQQIIQRFEQDRVAYADIQAYRPVTRDDQAARVHTDRVLEHVDVQEIRGHKARVVVESIHGAGGPEAAMLIRALDMELVHRHAEPSGRFPHNPEPTEQNLQALCGAVLEHRADVGFAQDPDADRLAIIDERGHYIGEEYTLALAFMHLLSVPHRDDTEKLVVANLSTSRMIDDLAARAGAKVVRTAVGEANVAGAIRAHRAMLGGEGNGGVIYPPVVHVRDSLVGMALVLELLSVTKAPLSELVARIPRYEIVKQKVDIAPGMAERVAPALHEAFDGQQIDTQDGVRVDWPDKWVHVRPSNTEPILRLIAEATNRQAAEALLAETRRAIGLT